MSGKDSSKWARRLEAGHSHWRGRVGAVLAIALAWGFATWVRMDWVRHAEGRPETQWQGHFLPTTTDSYHHALVIKQHAKESPNTKLLPGQNRPEDFGALTLIGVALVKHTGVHPANVVTYFSVFTAGLLAVPMVLLGRLYGSNLAGLLAAFVAVVASGYFSRTMAGYFDTDIFSVTLPALALYALLRGHRHNCLPSLIAGALLIFIFPFFYRSGAAVTMALGIAYTGFRWLEWLITRKTADEDFQFHTVAATALLGIAILFSSRTTAALWMHEPLKPLSGLGLLLATGALLAWLRKHHAVTTIRVLKYGSAAGLAVLLAFGNVMDTIQAKTMVYLPKLNEQQQTAEARANQKPAFQNVYHTIIEAKASSWRDLGKQVSGSTAGCLAAVAGYLLLLVLYREFLVALPFVGIGIFAHWGGNRFCVHAVPIAALSAVLLPWCLLELYRRWQKRSGISVPSKLNWPENPKQFQATHGRWQHALAGLRMVMGVLTLVLLASNLKSAAHLNRFVPSVLHRYEVQLLEDLRLASQPHDYVHTWWDWGAAVCYHADRPVLTSPVYQSEDTFVFAKMMSTHSPRLSSHLGQAAAEYFEQGSKAVDRIFDEKTLTPDEVLKKLENTLPVQPQRDVFLFLPDRLFALYHTLALFSERNLKTGDTLPPPQLFLFQKCRQSGNSVWLYSEPKDTEPAYVVDFGALTLSDRQRRLTPVQARDRVLANNAPLWDADAITLHSHKGLLFHTSNINFKGHQFEAQLLDNRTRILRGPLKEIEYIYPTRLLNRTENLDNQETREVEDIQEDSAGLILIYSTKSDYAILADKKAYHSQLVQLLVLRRPDPAYYELISGNKMGKVYKLKR